MIFKLIITMSFLTILPVAAHGHQASQLAEQTINSGVRLQPATTQPNETKQQTASLSHAEWLKGSVAFQEVSDWKGMLDWCQKWSESEPEDASAWHCLGYRYQMLHHHDDAIAAYLQTVRINPEDIDGWSNLGFVYADENRFDDAINAYLKVIHINPDDVEGLSNLLFVYLSSGNNAAAQETLQKLRSLNPEKADEVLEFVTPRK